MLQRRLQQTDIDSMDTRTLLLWYLKLDARATRRIEVMIGALVVYCIAATWLFFSILSGGNTRRQLTDDRFVLLACIALANTPPDTHIHRQIQALVDDIGKPCPVIPEPGRGKTRPSARSSGLKLTPGAPRPTNGGAGPPGVTTTTLVVGPGRTRVVTFTARPTHTPTKRTSPAPSGTGPCVPIKLPVVPGLPLPAPTLPGLC